VSINAKPIIKSVDELKREACFIVYEPYVADLHDQWMSKETIEKACINFNESLKKGVVVPNLFHCKNPETKIAEPTDSFSILKSWTTPVDCVIGDEPVTEGTWLTVIKFHNDALWNAFYVEKTVSGVSIGARGKIGND